MMVPSSRGNETLIIPQAHRWRKGATGIKVGAYNFIVSRNFLTNLSSSHIIWQPWIEVLPRAPPLVHAVANLVRMRLLIEARNIREWYLEERVTQQSIMAP